MANVTLNLEVDGYTNRVLGVIKEMFGLRNKGEALRKFAKLYGSEFVKQETSDETAREVIEESRMHMKKYGMRKMSLKELDEITGVG